MLQNATEFLDKEAAGNTDYTETERRISQRMEAQFLEEFLIIHYLMTFQFSP